MNVQMTLGELIAFLKKQNHNMLIDGLGTIDSYRRYPNQLAFDPVSSKISSSDLLVVCKDAKSGSFEGFKGGNYLMDNDTPLWVASYGECGTQLMSINTDGSLVTSDEII